MELFKIQNDSSRNLDHLEQMIQHFFPFAQEQLGFFKPVMVSFLSNEENANKLLGSTAHYDPNEFAISVYVDGRHPKDILRSLSHELVHHAQNCNGDFESTENLGLGYAQENGAMRNAELDAYKRGNIIFRDFEDLIKKGDIEIEIDFEKAGEPNMSLKEWKNNELNSLLMEKWGYKAQNEEQQIFAPNHYCAHHVRENLSGLEGRCVDHNWNEQLQEVTAYEVDFGDNDIRTLRVEELTILEASLPEGHPGHSARKEDHEDEEVNEQREDIGSKEHDDEEGNRPSFAKKMGLDEQDIDWDKKSGPGTSVPGAPVKLQKPATSQRSMEDTESRYKNVAAIGKKLGVQPVGVAAGRRGHEVGEKPAMAPRGQGWERTVASSAYEKARAAKKTALEESQKTITLDEARDLARRIFEKLARETK